MSERTRVYYTACCGKYVDRHSEDAKTGYLVTGEISATGDNYCSRCKRDVKRTGNVKDTPRNADIAANGSWGYETIKKQMR